jgi:SAM-dependent methyltransferase
MELDELARHWDEFGKQDPLWAIRTEPDKRGGKWEIGEFFGSGQTHVDGLVVRLAELGLPTRGAVLDFGCGVGRLTQAFADHYDEAWGVDIAPSMIEGAEAFNHHGSRVHYVVNERADLSCFEDEFFDLVFSVIVLQHMRPDLALGYVREFFRICKPGGAVVFQIPSHILREPFPDGAYAASFTAQIPAQVPAGRVFQLAVRVRNDGTATWPGQPDVLRLANHWLDSRGGAVQYDSGREPVPVAVAPGETVDLTLHVPVPTAPGAHVLEIDLVHEGIAWFGQKGSSTLRADVEVVGDDAPSRGKWFGRRKAATSADEIVLDDDGPDDSPIMEMHAVPREEVLALLAELGATVAAIDAQDNAPPWASYTYYVTKAATDSRNAR